MQAMQDVMKPLDPEDPMALVGVGLDEEPDDQALEEMAWCFVEEDARMGASSEPIQPPPPPPAPPPPDPHRQPQRGSAQLRRRPPHGHSHRSLLPAQLRLFAQR